MHTHLIVSKASRVFLPVSSVDVTTAGDQSVLISVCIADPGFGASADDLRAIPAERIGYIQLSDTTMHKRMEHYAEEAMFERMVPGEGELPLLDMLTALPEDLVVGLEIPMRSRAEAGISAPERLLPCIESARSLLNAARENH